MWCLWGTRTTAACRCQTVATAADGDGAAAGVPSLALCETVLEFFETAAAPVGGQAAAGRAAWSPHNVDGGVRDGALRVAALAEQVIS